MRRTLFLFTAFLAGVVAAGVICAGCSHSNGPGYTAPGPSPTPTATPSPTPSPSPTATPTPTPTPSVTYAGDVAPLLARFNCSGCHSPGNPIAGGTRLVLLGTPASDVAVVRALVDLGNPPASPILRPTNPAHGGGQLWQPGGPEASTVLAWAQGGAP